MPQYLEPPAGAGNLVEIAQLRASATPDELAYCFLIDGEIEGPRLTYAQLDVNARDLATRLRDIAEPGDRALLLYEPGIDFIPAFLGCLYAQIVPVPAYPPRLDRLAQSWAALTRLANDCTPRVGLTTADLAASLAQGMANQGAATIIHWLATDQLDGERAAQWRQPDIESEDVAFLQYTSGSTMAPRGVMVTHRNLLHNERMLGLATEHHGPGLGFCWLPLHHDLGLLGGVLQGLYHGAPVVLMSPLAMVQRPIRWLKAVSHYRADTSGGPNFAYEMCVERITEDQKQGLDLSNWSVAGVGAEPINPKTLERFAAAFEAYGFRPEAFYPSYGLAEATLFVAGRPKSARPLVRNFDSAALQKGIAEVASLETADSPSLVSCGQAWMEQELAIVNPESCARMGPSAIGEIWVHGPSVARGYWNRPDDSRRVFQATLAGEGGKTFLRTGDLGFILDGELFVTGRIKEVLIVRGRNYYPQDIEASAQACSPALRAGGGAVFEVDQGEGARLVLVQELDRKLGRSADLAKLVGDVRQTVAESFALQLHEVVFLEPGTLPRTTSGKIQRYACRQSYANGTLRAWRMK
jgi:acyl-CoA synthetase (AMP-forming)/AMP-acid ligase II